MATTRRSPVRGIRALTSLNPYDLASMADCAAPSQGASRRRRTWSAGARFLSAVRDGVVGSIRDGQITPDNHDSYGRDVVAEIADGAPDVYTHARWLQFVDLAAYQEESDAVGEWPDDLTDVAGIALYQIAERLCVALVDAWIEARG